MSKKFIMYDKVNTVRKEEYSEFKESIFSYQYDTAKKSILEIMKQNERYNSKQGQQYDDEIYNVISFIGGRGTGKTSAMLSFGDFLKKEDFHKYLFEETTIQIVEKDVSIISFGYIDAAMLVRNEGILDTILAQMWDFYDKNIKRSMGRMWENDLCDKEKIEKSFSEVKTDYNGYFRKSSEKGISSVKELHTLAGSINFRKAWSNLVKDFLELADGNKNKYLLIIIDDVDMAGANSFLILEQIHLFLNIPNVIVLLSADFRRLKQICAKHFADIYIHEYMGQKEELRQDMEHFANDYLGKIIAPNMRVYMPDVYQMNPDIYKEEKDHPVGKAKEIILRNLFKNGIEFDPTPERCFLEENTLRNTATMLHEIKELNDNDTAVEWLKKYWQSRLLERIDEWGKKEAAARMPHVGKNILNQYVVENIDGFLSEIYEIEENKTQNGVSLGSVLKYCMHLEGEDYDNHYFVEAVLTYYAILFAQMNEEEILNTYVRGTIWGNLQRENEIVRRGRDNYNFALKNFKCRFYMSDQEIDTMLTEANKRAANVNGCMVNILVKLINKSNIQILAYETLLAFFSDISDKKRLDDELFEGSVVSNTSVVFNARTDKKEIFSVHLSGNLTSNFYLDGPLIHLNRYFQICQNFEDHLPDIIVESIWHIQNDERWKIIRENANKDQVKSHLKDKLKLQKGWGMLEKITEWKNQWKEKFNLCLFPIKDIQFIYDIAKMIEQRQDSFSKGRMDTTLQGIYQEIAKYLKNRDEFFAPKNELRYKEVYEDYPVIAGLMKENPQLNEMLLELFIPSDLPQINKADM